MSKSKDIAKQLLRKPIKETHEETPHFQVRLPNSVQQADLLYLPSDNGFKYALVVVDIGSRLTDVIPLKSKTAQAVKNGFIKIYTKNKILGMPKFMEVDAGSEFKSVTRKYFEDNDVIVKVAKEGRSRQVGLVERRNQTIGAEVFTRQLEREITTNKVNKKWLKDLPEIIADMNKRYKVKKFKPVSEDPIITERNADLLDEGDKVRVILDKPRDYFDKKLSGRFRTTDIRWTKKVYPIEGVLIRASYPPLYLVDGVAYTRGQVQPVDE